MKIHSNDPAPGKAPRSVSGLALTRRNLVAAGAVVVAALTARGGNAAAQAEIGTTLKKGKKPKPNMQCFLQGTAVLTPQGEVEISTLRTGALVITQSGVAKPVVRVRHSVCERADG